MRDPVSTTETDIRSRPQPNCHVCGGSGRPLYNGLRDRLFGAPGTWNLKQCQATDCGLVWLDPMPLPEDIGQAYQVYYTHRDEAAPPATGPRRILRQLKAGYLSGRYGYPVAGNARLWRWLGRGFYLHPGQRSRLDARVFHLPSRPGGNLLEVGCGTGAALLGMRELGWQVAGVDFDADTVANARAKGLDVRHGDLAAQALAAASFDAIVMSHVIEHVPDPGAVLRECLRLLRPGGQLVIMTPNLEGWGHRHYGADWRGLETPRHLHLFTRRALVRLAEAAGFVAVHCETVPRAWKIFLASRLCAAASDSRQNGLVAVDRFGRGLRLWAETMELLSGWSLALAPGRGEELKLMGGKHE